MSASVMRAVPAGPTTASPSPASANASDGPPRLSMDRSGNTSRLNIRVVRTWGRRKARAASGSEASRSTSASPSDESASSDGAKRV